MSDVIGDAFAKRRVKGLRGLSFASYEMGWLDAVNHHRTDPRDELIKKLVGVLKPVSRIIDYADGDVILRGSAIDCSIKQALAEAKQLGYGE